MSIYRIEMYHFPITIDEYGPNYGHSYSPGWYEEFETAVQAVKENWMDIGELGMYQAAMIFKEEPGLLMPNNPNNRYYFIYDKETKTYQSIIEPEGLERYSL